MRKSNTSLSVGRSMVGKSVCWSVGLFVCVCSFYFRFWSGACMGMRLSCVVLFEDKFLNQKRD